MREIQKLDKGLLNAEFEVARSLYEQMRGQGYGPLKAAAMIYRHGYLDGRDTQRAKTSEAYKKLYASKSDEQPAPVESLPRADEERGNDYE